MALHVKTQSANANLATIATDVFVEKKPQITYVIRERRVLQQVLYSVEHYLSCHYHNTNIAAVIQSLANSDCSFFWFRLFYF